MLKKEVMDLSKGLRMSGLSDEFIVEFKNLYKIRSAQIMHAQREQSEITQDDVIKMKSYIDYLLRRYYTKIANKWLEERRSTTSESPAIITKKEQVV